MKLYRNILIFSIIIALLAVGIIVIKNMPDNGQVTEPAPNDEIESTNNYIDVLRLDTKDIVKISVKSEKDNYHVTKSNNEIFLNDSQNLKIAQDKLNMLFNSCSYIFAESIVSSKKEDAQTFGFDTPVATVIVTLNNGTERTISIGKESIDKQGSYIMVDGDDNIYLRSAYGVSNLVPEYNSFIDTAIFSVDPTNYETLKSIYMKKTGNTPVRITSSGEDETKIWKMSEPAYADANTIVLSEQVLTPLSTLNVAAVVDAKPADTTIYGFAEPYATIEIISENTTQTLQFGDVANGYRFLKIDNFSTVYAVDDSALSFLDVSYIDLMSRLIHLENIKNVSKVHIRYPGGEFLMKIDGENRSVNGVDMSKDDFADIYQRIIGISLDSVDTNISVSSDSETEIVYTRNDGTVCKVSFVPVDDRNYLALVDGKGNCIVKKSSVSDVIDYTKKAVESAK